MTLQFWPLDRNKPTRDNYLEIATLTVGYRNRGLARYRDPKATIAAAVSAAERAPNFETGIDAISLVLEAAEHDGHWDGSIA